MKIFEPEIRTNNTTRLRMVSINLAIWLFIFFQRLVVKLGEEEISFSLILFYLFLAFWIVTGKLNIHWKRVIYYFFVSGFIITASLMSFRNAQFYSLNSLMLLLVLYLPTIFNFKNTDLIAVLRQFQKVVLFISIIGFLQFILQLVQIRVPDIWSFLPREIVTRRFNYLIPLEWGSNIYKSNGLFFLEPSFYSQFVALAILLELNLFKKYRRLFVFFPALLFSFSGTGLLLLVFGSILLISKGRLKQIFLFSLLVLILGGIFISSGYGQYITRRIFEFQRPGSSGYQRFISPIVNYWNFLNSEDIVNIVFGLGPGSSNRYFWSTPVEPNVFIKLFVEYGFFGFIFLLYIIHIFFENKPSWLSLNFFFTFSILSGGSILVPQIVVIFYVVLFLNLKIANRKSSQSNLENNTA